MSSEQKVAIVTGASQGIGASLVKAFRDRNYRVVATSRSIEQTNDQDIVAVRGDVGDEGVVRAGLVAVAEVEGLVGVVHQGRHLAEAPAEQFLDAGRRGGVLLRGTGQLDGETVDSQDHR